MEFKKVPRKQRSPSPKQPTPPSVSNAFKFSVKIIKSAVSHATKSVANEAKELIKLTEEEFDLHDRPLWQKLRGIVRGLTRRISRVKLTRKAYMIIGLVVVIGIGGLVTNHLLSKSKEPTTSKPYSSTKLEKGTPTYATLLPTGKSIKSLGGWTRVSPSTASPVYAFVDRVDTITVKVSQQPLPDALNKAAEVEEFAKAGGYDQKVTVEDIDIYIGTSTNGPQSAILTKNDLLILIKADSKLTDSQWADYVANLN